MRYSMLVFMIVLCSSVGMSRGAENSCLDIAVGYHGPIRMVGLVPQHSGFSGSEQLVSELFESLLIIGEGGEPIPAAAKSWHYENNGREVHFLLRPEARWSDGAPVTAEDFKAGLEVYLSDESNDYAQILAGVKGLSQWRDGQSSNISGIRAPEVHRLIFDLEQSSNFALLPMIANSFAVPVPLHQGKDVLKKEWGDRTQKLSNGPFRFVKQDDSGTHLERNPHYWNESEVQVENLMYSAQTTDNVLQSYLDEEIDVVLDVSFKQLSWVRKYLETEYHESQPANMIYIALDTRDPLLSSTKIRRVMSLLIDRPSVIQYSLGGVGNPLYSMIPPVYDDYQSKVKADSLNRDERVAKAREIMEQEGYGPDKPFAVQLGYYNISAFETMALALRESWLPSWIEIELIRYDDDFMLYKQDFEKGEFDIAIFTWHADNTYQPESYLQVFNNFGAFGAFYEDSDYRKMLEELESAGQQNKRRKLAADAEFYLHQQSPAIPVGWWVGGSLFKPTLDSIEVAYSDGYLNSEWFTSKQAGCS